MERPHHTPENEALPEPLPINFAGIPETLQKYDQWVVWNYRIIDEEIKKPPYSPTTGTLASVRDPATWGSFHNAQTAYATGKFAGIGIVLTSERGIVGIDLDHCISDGRISNGSQQIIAALHSYTEVSPSGNGIRIILEAKLPGARRRKGRIELYEDLRYVTITGQHLAATPHDIQPRHKELYGLYQRLFPHTDTQARKENTGGVGNPQHSQQSRPDEEVLHKALSAKNGENFKRYYAGDPSLWEGAGARHTSQSEADFTLVLMLLYWTNNDTSQVDRLFRQSGLMRQKWQRPIQGSETYGERIIQDAIRKGNQ